MRTKITKITIEDTLNNVKVPHLLHMLAVVSKM